MAFVLFDSVWGLLSCIPITVLHKVLSGRREEEEAEKSFDEKYRELLSGLSGGLRAGHSLENSFRDAENSLVLVYGREDPLAKELSQMNRQIGMHLPVEDVFNEFAKRHPVEEVENMAEILSIGKRMGGNYVRNISEAAEKIRQSLELKEKIAVLTAEKRLELKMMLIMPPAMLTYIRIASPEFIRPMYGTPLGVGAVFACLAMYGGAMLWGRRIIRIEV